MELFFTIAHSLSGTPSLRLPAPPPGFVVPLPPTRATSCSRTRPGKAMALPHRSWPAWLQSVMPIPSTGGLHAYMIISGNGCTETGYFLQQVAGTLFIAGAISDSICAYIK